MLGQISVSLAWGSPLIFNFYILKCSVGPSFIRLVMSAVSLSEHIPTHPTPATVFFPGWSACVTLWSVNYWAVNFNFLRELWRKLSLNVVSLKTFLKHGLYVFIIGWVRMWTWLKNQSCQVIPLVSCYKNITCYKKLLKFSGCDTEI